MLCDKANFDWTDIFPTGKTSETAILRQKQTDKSHDVGWHGVEISGFKSGESIAVFGAGPVGLMAAYSATLRGASRVYVVDRVPERLEAAAKIGCIPIDFSKSDAVEQIKKHNNGEVDRSVDAVGYQAVSGSAEQPNIVLENMIKVTRACGGLGIPGLYVPRCVQIVSWMMMDWWLTLR